MTNINNNDELKSEIINKVLDNQSLEIKTRQLEISLNEQEMKFSQEYALAALASQKEDRRECRATHKDLNKIRFSYVLCGFVSVLIFSVVVIHQGHAEIITDSLKILIPSIISGFGGFYFGRNKNAKN